jgi:hypothetical protein
VEQHDLARVSRDFPGWQIRRHESGRAWDAVLRRGTFLHVLVAYDLPALQARLREATRAESDTHG